MALRLRHLALRLLQRLARRRRDGSPGIGLDACCDCFEAWRACWAARSSAAPPGCATAASPAGCPEAPAGAPAASAAAPDEPGWPPAGRCSAPAATCPAPGPALPGPSSARPPCATGWPAAPAAGLARRRCCPPAGPVACSPPLDASRAAAPPARCRRAPATSRAASGSGFWPVAPSSRPIPCPPPPLSASTRLAGPSPPVAPPGWTARPVWTCRISPPAPSPPHRPTGPPRGR